MNTNKKWFIYSLSDPRSCEVRYIGKTIAPLSRRLKEHLRDGRLAESKSRHKQHWLAGLMAEGILPVIAELERGEGDNTWQEAERRWITEYKAAGADLTNISEGGAGSHNRRTSEETRKLISEKLRGRPVSEETRRRISEANSGKKRSPEVVAAMSERMKGTKRSPESVEKTAAALRGRKATPEERARMSAAQRGKKMPPHSPERRAQLAALLQSDEVQAKRREAVATEQWRQRQSESHKGKKIPADVVEKTAAKLRGVPKSEETRRRMSEGQAARHARIRAERDALMPEV